MGRRGKKEPMLMVLATIRKLEDELKSTCCPRERQEKWETLLLLENSLKFEVEKFVSPKKAA